MFVYTIQPVVKTAGCQTGLTAVLNEQPLFVQPVVKPGCTTGLTTGCMHDTAICQTGCQTGLTTGCIVYRLYKHLPSCHCCLGHFKNTCDDGDDKCFIA